MSISELDMFSEFSIKGSWWLPNNPGDQVSGTLHFSNENIKLRLDRSFLIPELVSAYSVGSFKAPVVLGHTNDRNRCTILRAFYLSSHGNEVVLAANALLVGVHLIDESNLPIHEALLRFIHLEDWTGQPLVRDMEGSTPDHFTFVVPTAAKPVFRVEGPPQFKRLVLWNGIQISRTRTQTSLTSQNHFQLDFDPPANLPTVNQMIRGLANVLSLLVGETALPRKIRLITHETGTDEARTVDYFVPSRTIPPKAQSEFDMPFPLRDFGDGDSAGNLFKEWFLKEGILRPVCDLLLSTIYNPSQYVQSTFLSLAQALESFHRRTRDGIYVPKEDYAKIREALALVIPAGTTPEFKEKLLSALAFGNELSLRTRIRQLFEGIDSQHAIDLTGYPKLQDFIALFTGVRNYLTHYDERHRPAIIDNIVDMYNLNRRLRAILTLMLFKYLGMNEDRLFLPLKSHLSLF
jgi:hypothetical protein